MELAIDPEEIELDPQYDVYMEREKRGELVFVTVRKAGALIGYFIGFRVWGLHNKGHKFLLQDIFYITPEHRLTGAGDVLFDAVEREYRRLGGGEWIVACKVHLDCGDFFRRRGFREVERSYRKRVV
jgi:GNAT superfamily N-acetyltransferase